MHLIQPTILVASALSIVQLVAGMDDQHHRQQRRAVGYSNDERNDPPSDLDMITDSPGPPTIQPGIPALQPSIPTEGVPSLSIPSFHGPPGHPNTPPSDLDLITDSPGPPTIQPGIPAMQPSIPSTGLSDYNIPPARQTSKAPDKLSTRSADYQATGTFSASPLNPDPTTMPNDAGLGNLPSLSAPSGSASSIPFLSELIAHPSRSQTQSPGGASTAPLNYAYSQPNGIESQSPQETGSGFPTSTMADKDDSQNQDPPAPIPSTLIYSFTLSPYSGGLETSGIPETMTRSPTVVNKDSLPLATTYPYKLQPYTPKVPTYVATSAQLAAVTMTAGPSGNPVGNAQTTRIFLSHGFVDPTKGIPSADRSTIVPLYSPACLGNAYGGGYVITPTSSVPHTNATGGVKIPPAYGFTYKSEPTASPDYDAAVIIAGTTGQMPSAGPIPTATFDKDGAGISTSGYGQQSGGIVGTGGQVSNGSPTSTAPGDKDGPGAPAPGDGQLSGDIIEAPCPCTGASTVTSTFTAQGMLSESPVVASGSEVLSLPFPRPTFGGTGSLSNAPMPTSTSSGNAGPPDASNDNPNLPGTIDTNGVDGNPDEDLPGNGMSDAGQDYLQTKDATAFAPSSTNAVLPSDNANPSASSMTSDLLAKDLPFVTSQTTASSAPQLSSSGPSSGNLDQPSGIEPHLVHGLQSPGTLVDYPGSTAARPSLSGMEAYIDSVMHSTTFPWSGISTDEDGNIAADDSLANARPSLVPSSTTASSIDMAPAAGGATATMQGPDNLYRAAGTIGTGIANTNTALSTAYIASQVNSSLILPTEGSGIVAFQGASSKVSAAPMLAITLVLVMYLTRRNM
ncbi:MAG: hypothetical protein Q9174_003361 [Haloplaca sp. 1 TL-2023]